jgi:hypothetical protein
MKWKLIFDSNTFRGIDYERPAADGEFLVELNSDLCGYFRNTPQRYQYVDGVFSEVRTWEAELAEQVRLISFNNLKARIIEKRRAMNDANFQYLEVEYISDEPNIAGVRLQIEGLDDTDPIPTFTGTAIASTWANAENGFTPMNCGQFRAFASHYYSHREKNFTNYTMLTIAATQAYMAGSTAEQLLDFDITQGWD